MTIKRKLMLSATVLCVLSGIVAVWVNSHLLRRVFYNQYKEKAIVLLYSMKAVRSHMGEVIRPKASELIGNDFVTELQSTSYAANSVFSKIPAEDRFGLNFKTPSIKPRNPKNQATEVEAEIIHTLNDMQQRGQKPVWQGFRKIDGVENFIIAVGEVNGKSCMRCHGRPEDAPEGMRRIYPVETDKGYGHIADHVESAEIVSIPVASVNARLDLARSYIIVFSIFILTITVVGIKFYLDKIFYPVERVTKIAGHIADGNLQSASESLDAYVGSKDDQLLKEESRELRDETDKLLHSFTIMTHRLSSLIGQVQESGIQVTTSATQIAASARELEATATEQAASLNEVMVTSHEIYATSQDLTGTIVSVAGKVSATATLAGQGQNGLEEMEGTMRQLVKASTSFSAKLSTINEKAMNIGSIITTIAKVADQTNLLSLNAAIEAEKAGEYGLGFSVVAREIRRLADQTGVATQDIELMVREMQSAVSAGVMEMDRFSEEVRRGVQEVSGISNMLGQIIFQVQELEPQFAKVGGGMQVQSEGAQQISEAMDQLAVAAEQTRASLYEFKRATEGLNEVVQGLRKEVLRFKVSH